MTRLHAGGLIDLVLDDGTWQSWDAAPDRQGVGDVYGQTLARAALRSGTDESVVTGEGRLRGRRVAVVAGEFAFLAGSIGVAAVRRVVDAVERATAEQVPLLAAPSSGGTRMQEGTPAFL